MNGLTRLLLAGAVTVVAGSCAGTIDQVVEKPLTQRVVQKFSDPNEKGTSKEQLTEWYDADNRLVKAVREVKLHSSDEVYFVDRISYNQENKPVEVLRENKDSGSNHIFRYKWSSSGQLVEETRLLFVDENDRPDRFFVTTHKYDRAGREISKTKFTCFYVQGKLERDPSQSLETLSGSRTKTEFKRNADGKIVEIKIKETPQGATLSDKEHRYTRITLHQLGTQGKVDEYYIELPHQIYEKGAPDILTGRREAQTVGFRIAKKLRGSIDEDGKIELGTVNVYDSQSQQRVGLVVYEGRIGEGWYGSDLLTAKQFKRRFRRAKLGIPMDGYDSGFWFTAKRTEPVPKRYK